MRQLTVFYHYIHYLLDRPFLNDREWPQYREKLADELEQTLEIDRIPDEWTEALFLREKPRSEKERIRFQKYRSSLGPLFDPIRAKIREIRVRLDELKSSSRQFSRISERNVPYREGLRKIREWALRKSWEVAGILGFQNI